MAGAQSRLASLSYNGQDVPTNYDQAFAWAQKSAAQQNMFGELVLSNLYAQRRGVPADARRAAFWREHIAEQNNALMWSHLDDKGPSGLTLRQVIGIGSAISLGIMKSSLDEDAVSEDCAMGIATVCNALSVEH